MKINTKKVLNSLKGEPLKNEDKLPLTVGETLSNIMTNYKAGGKMKTYILAKKFMDNDEVDLDEADFSLVKTACEQDESYLSSIVSGQILVYLNELK
jgi:hypothetical protein